MSISDKSTNITSSPPHKNQFYQGRNVGIPEISEFVGPEEKNDELRNNKKDKKAYSINQHQSNDLSSFNLSIPSPEKCKFRRKNQSLRQLYRSKASIIYKSKRKQDLFQYKNPIKFPKMFYPTPLYFRNPI